MNTKNVSMIKYGLFAIVIAMSLSQTALMGQVFRTDPQGSGIEGTWDLEVTFVDCATGSPLFPPGKSLVSFTVGGTLIEEASGVPPSVRYPGLGIWERTRPRHYEYSFKFFQFNEDGTSHGKIVVNAETVHNQNDTLTTFALARYNDSPGDLTLTRCVDTKEKRYTGEN